MSQIFISLKDVSLRPGTETLFRNLHLDLQKGEHWLITGPAGIGKTVLLEALAGRLAISAGERTYPAISEMLRNQSVHDPLTEPGNFISYISSRHHFRNLSNTTEFYYQQRFNSIDSGNAPTVEKYLQQRVHPLHGGEWTLERVISLFKLDGLLDKELIKLSNGETKRLLLAAALIRNPAVLAMDNPLSGLDVDSRKQMNEWLRQVADSGITILMTGSLHEIPDSVTDILVIQSDRSLQKIPRTAAVEQLIPAAFPVPDETVLNALLNRKPVPSFSTIVRMKDVNIRYGEKKVLEGINWEVKQGERWALIGGNGAGKSTLLSLINGDNPQAYANDIVLFDRKRGSGESIWDIKKHIGFISPELFQYFPMDISCLHVIESGFYDTIGLFRPSSRSLETICRQWMEEMNISQLASRSFRLVSASQQRLCLLARALVKNPALLILDEPCQGMDDAQQQFFRTLIDLICRNSPVTVIYVSHYAEEFPECVDRVFRLENGRVM